MIFNGSPFDWMPPKRKWWFWPLVTIRMFWVILITFILAPVLIVIRILQASLGISGYEYGVLRVWGRLSWLAFSVRPIIHGTPIKGEGAIVSNHSSWLDIPIIFGSVGAYMVSKAEVRGWPVIGWIARGIGTAFVDRKRSTSKLQTENLLSRLKNGDRIAFFPEGTSTDALRVVGFRSTLFAAMVEANPEGFVQPVSIVYHAPKDASVNFFGWWGEMPVAPHMLAVLGLSKRAKVDLVFHEPIQIGTDRKALCAACQAAVEAGFTEFADKIEAP